MGVVADYLEKECLVLALERGGRTRVDGMGLVVCWES